MANAFGTPPSTSFGSWLQSSHGVRGAKSILRGNLADIWKIRASDGASLWGMYDPDNGTVVNVTFGDNESLYVGYDAADHLVTKFDADREIEWQLGAGTATLIHSTATALWLHYGSGRLAKYDNDGSEEWDFSLGTLFFSPHDGDDRFMTYTPSNGNMIYRRPTAVPLWDFFTIGTSRDLDLDFGFVYSTAPMMMGFNSHGVHKRELADLDNPSELVWRGLEDIEAKKVAVGGGNLYAISVNLSPNKIYRLSVSSGVAFGGNWPVTLPSGTPNDIVVDSSGSVYVIAENSDDGTLFKYSPSGVLQWQWHSGAPAETVSLFSLTVMTDGNIAVCGDRTDDWQ